MTDIVVVVMQYNLVFREACAREKLFPAILIKTGSPYTFGLSAEPPAFQKTKCKGGSQTICFGDFY